MRVVREGLCSFLLIKTTMTNSTTKLFFDYIEISVSWLVGEEWKGFRYINCGRHAERLFITAECISDAKLFIKTLDSLLERPAIVQVKALFLISLLAKPKAFSFLLPELILKCALLNWWLWGDKTLSSCQHIGWKGKPGKTLVNWCQVSPGWDSCSNSWWVWLFGRI